MKYLFCITLLFNLIYSSETITIFANNYKPPKVWTENNIHKGILVEVIRSVEDELDVKFDIQTYPWARSYKMAKYANGGIIGISLTKERKEIFDFNTVPLFLDTMILITKKGKEFPFDKIEDLEGKKIGYCRGCSFGKIFEDAKKYFIPVETDDSREQRLMLLLHDKIDAALLGPGDFALKTICNKSKMLEYSQFTVLKKPLIVDPNYLAFSKKLDKKEFLKKFDKALQKKIDEKMIENILKNMIEKE